MTKEEALIKIGELVVYARAQGWDDDYTDAFKTLEQESKWIPVSKKLPDKEGFYLASVKNEHGRRYSKTCYYMGKNHWFARQEVEAWMPSPISYEAKMEVADGN